MNNRQQIKNFLTYALIVAIIIIMGLLASTTKWRIPLHIIMFCIFLGSAAIGQGFIQRNPPTIRLQRGCGIVALLSFFILLCRFRYVLKTPLGVVVAVIAGMTVLSFCLRLFPSHEADLTNRDKTNIDFIAAALFNKSRNKLTHEEWIDIWGFWQHWERESHKWSCGRDLSKLPPGEILGKFRKYKNPL